MPNRRGRAIRAWAVLLAVATATVGVAWAQNPKANPKAARGRGAGRAKGGVRAPVAPPKNLGRGGDAFAGRKDQPEWPYHVKFKLASFDDHPLVALYYPARHATNAPVVLLVHERNRSGKDFEDPIEDLKGQGLAEHLQQQGYAVLVVDLRGHGANPRREVGPRDAEALIRDLQAAYQFLIDRHNREELNLAKLGVIALGEGADLAAAWAAAPGAAVSSEGRLSDLGALVLVSPTAEGFHHALATPLAALAPRVPLLLVVGERDHAAFDAVKAAQAVVARQRQNKVEAFPTSLHGYKLLRFQPGVPGMILRFLDTNLKTKRDDWEPRYNLTPVAFSDPEVVKPKSAAGAAKAAPATKAKDKAPAAKKDEGR